jgi:hypothetical protein
MTRKASITESGTDFYVVFGFRDGVEFICSLSRKPRFYKSVKAAEKAKRDWESIAI